MKFTKFLFVFSYAVLTFGFSSNVFAQLPDNLDEIIENVRQELEIAGLSVAVVKDNEVIYAKGFGVKELGKPDLVDENTLFAIGSNSKAFTSASIGILVDEGKMSWDDKVTDHLPRFELYDPYVTREITIRDILSHRSGLGRRGDGNWYATDFDREEIVRRIRHLEPNSSFRTKMGYQNTMFLAAGLAAEAASRIHWDNLIKAQLFDPLGMDRSSTSTNGLSVDNNVATPHQHFGDVVKPIPYRNIDNIAPAGSLNSSAMEMTNWVRMILNDGEFEGEQILSKVSVNEVLTPHISIPVGPSTKQLTPSTHFQAYGLGWVVNDYLGEKMVWHNGGIDGMISQMTLIPEQNLGVVVLTNTMVGVGPVPIIYTIVDAFLGGDEKDWVGIYSTLNKQGKEAQKAQIEKLKASRIAGTTPSLNLSDYVGEYKNDMYGTAKITLENGKLILKRHTAFVGDMEHWHYDTFYAHWRDLAMSEGPGSEVTFHLDGKAKVESVDIQDIGVFKKIE